MSGKSGGTDRARCAVLFTQGHGLAGTREPVQMRDHIDMRPRPRDGIPPQKEIGLGSQCPGAQAFQQDSPAPGRIVSSVSAIFSSGIAVPRVPRLIHIFDARCPTENSERVCDELPSPRESEETRASAHSATLGSRFRGNYEISY